jgi:chromosome segregation protein
MYLKKIRARNFKSFAGATEIPFTPGFTGIAGPNGMGKSNIADAVLFVLGPTSSKALRADRLTHLFFNGGASKRPSTECEVALIFDNRDRMLPVDSDEVELSRHVKLMPSDPNGYYSYFYVNGRRSTQGDIDHILSHARLAGDGYNIVQQGDVNKIVSMGPIPRRALVERLAGISQYDEELERAATRRVELDQNLDRIGTLLTEIRSHLASLEAQRREALRYKEFQDEKRSVERKLARAGLLLARQEVTTCEGQVSKIQALIAKWRTEVARLEGERDRLAQAISDVEDEIARRSGADAQKFKLELDTRRMAYARLEERFQSSQDALHALAEKVEALRGEIRRSEQEVEALTRKEKGLAETLRTATTATEKDRSTLAELTGQTERSRGRLLELRKQMLVSQEKLDALGKDWQESVRALESARGSSAAAEEETARAQEEVETRQVEVRDLELRVKQFRGAEPVGRSTLDLQQSFLALKSKEKILTDKVEALNREVQELNRRYLALDARLKARAGGSGAAASPHAAVEFLLSQRNLGKIPGIRGTVEELAEFDPQYRTALTMAAGSRFQALVVETDQVAEDCIRLLRSEKRGRATFLPLNKMLAGRPHGKSLIAAKAPGALGFAVDLVKFDENLRPAFWYVFGETVVMDELVHAREQMGGVRLVTLQGDLIEATGAITGGFVEVSGRADVESAAELKRLGHELKAQSEAEAAARAELTEAEADIRSLAEELARRSGQDASQATARQAVEQELSQARQRLTEAHGRVRRAEKALQEARARAAQGEANAQEIQARLRGLKEAHERLQEEYLAHMPGAVSEKVRALQETIRSADEERVRLEREAAGTQASLKAATEQLAARRADLDELEKSHGAADRQIKTVQRERDEAKAALEALKSVEAKQLAAAQEFAAKKGQLESERLQVVEQLTRANGQMETQEALQQREEVRLAQAQQNLEELAKALESVPASDEDASTAGPAEGEQPAPIEQLKRRVAELNGQIEAMGAVNLRALEEYDAEKSRLGEFDQEVERLGTEKAELERLVGEIEKKKRVRLTEVVAHVSQRFHEIYAELDGGEGEIVLENADDPLAGGLFIKAKPTGKKIQRLEQLSGGEKSLASLAFIFALQRYDPSPLYVFDEVDMSLDAVNAENLGRMLRRNAERAQFIVISLRKVTLQFAHRLFGVTMHGDGCSRVVGLKLDEIVDVDERDRERPSLEVGSEAA